MSINPEETTTEKPAKPETRKLNENTTKIRETIYELARSGKTFSIDDVFDKLGSRENHGVIHATLLSASKLGLLERAGKVKGSRSTVTPEEWLTGTEPKKREVQAYRGALRLQRKEKK